MRRRSGSACVRPIVNGQATFLMATDTDPANRTAARRRTPAETEQSASARMGRGPCVTQRCVRQEGMLVRLRAPGRRGPGEITGTRPGWHAIRTGAGSDLVCGGKLAADLTLPKLRQRWIPTNAPASYLNRITAAEHNLGGLCVGGRLPLARSHRRPAALPAGRRHHRGQDRFRRAPARL
jgi:hypothetical protein